MINYPAELPADLKDQPYRFKTFDITFNNISKHFGFYKGGIYEFSGFSITKLLDVPFGDVLTENLAVFENQLYYSNENVIYKVKMDEKPSLNQVKQLEGAGIRIVASDLNVAATTQAGEWFIGPSFERNETKSPGFIPVVEYCLKQYKTWWFGFLEGKPAHVCMTKDGQFYLQ